MLIPVLLVSVLLLFLRSPFSPSVLPSYVNFQLSRDLAFSCLWKPLRRPYPLRLLNRRLATSSSCVATRSLQHCRSLTGLFTTLVHLLPARSPRDLIFARRALGIAQIPGLPEILASLTPQSHPGLLGICLSGAGPTILALATENFEVRLGSRLASFRLPHFPPLCLFFSAFPPSFIPRLWRGSVLPQSVSYTNTQPPCVPRESPRRSRRFSDSMESRLTGSY